MINNNSNKYKLKKTISMKKFISEFGETFSPHVKARLLELEMRSVLTRKEDMNILDIKHVEHTKYKDDTAATTTSGKEYAFGQFIAIDGDLFFSKNCIESDTVMQADKVINLYDTLGNNEVILEADAVGKKLDDSNIDFFVDGMLSFFPEVSKKYTQILKEMMSYEKVR